MASIEQRISRMEAAMNIDDPFGDWTDEEINQRLGELYAKLLPDVQRAIILLTQDEARGSYVICFAIRRSIHPQTNSRPKRSSRRCG